VQIAPYVHQIPTPASGVMGWYAPNIYLAGGREAALVDAGYRDSKQIQTCIDYIRRMAPDGLTYILVTHPHPDHVGGCHTIKDATGARIVLYSAGVSRAGTYRVTPDVLVDDGDVLSVGGARIRVVPTPGHTSDHVCFYLEGEEVLFTGDHILGFGTPVIAPDGDMAQYIESLRKLLDYPIRLLCPGHGPLVREPHRKIRELIAHRLEREQQLLTLLGRGRKSVKQMAAEIYPELDPRLMELALSQVRAHLQKLVREGRVAASGEEYVLQS
jgi:glyoxylase-like metal-dependent hydrolase (beta-lactamase superfamily II)